MRAVFEVGAQDGAGRIGELEIPRAGVTVETPTLMPVVNPNLITVEPSRFPDFGAEMLITNSYIVKNDPELNERALDEGLHEMLGFDGAIMTDSGSFQLAEYGEIDTHTEEILQFQYDIGSDVGTPVDIPTPPDADREQAETELATTQERLELAATVDVGDMLVNAPVQGSTYPELREEAGRHAYGTGLDLFPVGAVVPLMNQYRYDDMTEAVLAAKRGLGRDAPVHLFGAGHPMMFALAAALGCDLFDSAAYAIYARDDRYLTVDGTEHLDDLHYFPCDCPVCADHTPPEVQGMSAVDRAVARRAQPLRLLRGDPPRQAGHQVREPHGTRRIPRARPPRLPRRLPRAPRPRRPAGGLGPREQGRLPVHLRGQRAPPRGAAPPPPPRTPRRLRRRPPHGGLGQQPLRRVVERRPAVRPVPPRAVDDLPLTAETPDRMDRAGFEAAAEGVRRLAEANPKASFTLGHRGWPDSALALVPERVELVDISPEGE